MRLPEPEELAKYILTTGDQETVVSLIEALLQEGEVGLCKSNVLVKNFCPC